MKNQNCNLCENKPFSIERGFSTVYVDSGLNFSSLKGKNQFPNQLHGSNTYFWKRASKKNTLICLRRWRVNCTRWWMLRAFSKKTRNWDFGNNIFHGTVDSVHVKVCSKRHRRNRQSTRTGLQRQGVGPQRLFDSGSDWPVWPLMQRDDPHRPPTSIAFGLQLGLQSFMKAFGTCRKAQELAGWMLWSQTEWRKQVGASKKLQSSVAVSWVVAGCDGWPDF